MGTGDGLGSARPLEAPNFPLFSGLAFEILGPLAKSGGDLVRWRLRLTPSPPLRQQVRVDIQPEIVHRAGINEGLEAFWRPEAPTLALRWRGEGAGPAKWTSAAAVLSAIDVVHILRRDDQPVEPGEGLYVRGRIAGLHSSPAGRLALATWPETGESGRILVFGRDGEALSQIGLGDLPREDLLGLALSHGGDLLASVERPRGARAMRLRLHEITVGAGDRQGSRTLDLFVPPSRWPQATAGLEFDAEGALVLCHLPRQSRDEGSTWIFPIGREKIQAARRHVSGEFF